MSSTKYTIRTATLQDAEQIAHIHIRAWQESYHNILPEEFLQHLSYEQRLSLRKTLLSTSTATSLYLVATDNNHVIGFCDAGPSRSSTIAKGEIYAIYLLNAYKHQGIGTALWQQATNFLKANKLSPFYVWVLKENTTARLFYERQGGRVSHEETVEIGDTPYIEVCYLFNSR